ncbi:glycosyl transferase [Sulfolobales archaeon HS-7]|nr:glycosyl transferase [Sulfolobales archaeon HS-7]
MDIVLLPGSTENAWDGIEVYSYEVGRRLAEKGHNVVGIKLGDKSFIRDVSERFSVKYIAVPGIKGGLGYHMRFGLAVSKSREALLNSNVIHAIGGYYAPIEFLPHKKVVTVIGASSLREKSSMKKSLRRLMGRMLYKMADAYIAPNQLIKNELEVYYKISNPFLIPNGVDLDGLRVERRKEIRDKFGISPDEKVVLYLGQLVYGKRLKELIVSFAKLSETEEKARLILVAWGYLKDQIQALIKDLRITSKVSLIKPVKYPERKYAYSLGDVFVMMGESFGDGGVSSALLDAMGAGLPVIVSKNSVNSSLVIDGYNGYSVNPEVTESVVMAMKNCIYNSELGQRSLEIARNYDWGKIAEEIIKVYEYALRK